ncbi:MFS transporter [Streptomyces gilvifuscus]|uniref:MFS transporter n=1 Tax=Streptomyces gilvifuscus TaxID=1550617 RepID=A0ABT5FTR9_9ACTN|nr:MFS transporter [Streptomyces gilvifuscus]MDC2955909.1 MFS transporter [Streptomyces gilvifuscus]
MAGSCLPVLGAVLLAPVLPKLQDHFATVADADALVPMILTIPALALALLAPLAGVLVDRLGRRAPLVVATVLYALFGTAPLWLDSLGAIVAARALLGVAEAFIMTSCTTLIGDYYTGRVRDRYLALQSVCATVSATAFFILGGGMGSADWRAPFQLYAVGLLLAPAMAAFLRQPTPDVAADEAATVGRRGSSGLRLAGICLLSVFGGIVFYIVPAETAYLMNGLGVGSSGLIGMVTAIASAATVTGCVIFASLIGRPERRLPAIFALCGAGLVVIGLAHDVAVLIIGTFLSGIGTGFLLPSLVTWAMSKLEYGNRGRGTGLWTASFFLGQFLCPLAVIALESVTGDLTAAVAAVGLASVLVAIGLLPLLRRTTDAKGARRA